MARHVSRHAVIIRYPDCFALFSKFPSDDIAHAERVPLKALLKDKVLWLMVLVLTFGVVSELAVGGWLVNFWRKHMTGIPLMLRACCPSSSYVLLSHGLCLAR